MVNNPRLREDRESATDFHKDLDNWVSEVSEVFHYRVFIIDSLLSSGRRGRGRLGVDVN